MKKRIFVIDYKRNGVDAHECMEIMFVGEVADEEIVEHIRQYIRKKYAVKEKVRLCSIIEVLLDLTVKQLETIVRTPIALTLPQKVIYMNAVEVCKAAEEMKARKGGSEQ